MRQLLQIAGPDYNPELSEMDKLELHTCDFYTSAFGPSFPCCDLMSDRVYPGSKRMRELSMDSRHVSERIVVKEVKKERLITKP